jgi:hypothetical protein
MPEKIALRFKNNLPWKKTYFFRDLLIIFCSSIAGTVFTVNHSDSSYIVLETAPTVFMAFGEASRDVSDRIKNNHGRGLLII